VIIRNHRTACSLCESQSFKPKISLNRHGESYAIVQCSSCGHTFVSDPPADTANHIDIDKIGWAFRPRHHQIRRLILSHLQPGQRVLEIGCGRGEVGFLLRNDPVEYIAYEPARGLSDFGIREGISIVQRVFNGEETADAIIVDNVIEHVTHPKQIIEVAARSLNPGGILVVITPNVDDIRAMSKSWRERHLWVPPDHINFFSASDITRMFAAVGLSVRRFKFSPLKMSDWKFFPRGAAEALGLSIFGHNVYAIQPGHKPGNFR
jgi:2-polyprenyl-3-methyl-5-hydroxy-6-metoxy-1,4-benzoquinol methylase